MNDIIISLIAIICNLVIFFLFGILFFRLIKIEISFMGCILTGLFVYFGCFTLVYYPFLFLRISFTHMMITWCVVCLGICVFSVKINYIEILKLLQKKCVKTFSVLEVMLLFLTGICVVCFMVNSVKSCSVSFDTAYYSRVVGYAVNENSMYGSYSGGVVRWRYALSAYYMHAAINAKLFGLHHLTTLKIVMGGLCNLYAFLIVCIILKELFSEIILICSGCLVWILGMNAFYGMYNQAGFLIDRAYEAKAWCGNIIVPFCLWCIFQLWKGKRRGERRGVEKIILLISGTANMISMSSLLVIPATLLCGLTPLIIVDKKKKDMLLLIRSLILSIGFMIFYLVLEKYIRIGV